MAPGASRIALAASALVLLVAGCTEEPPQPSRLSNEATTSVSASPSASSDEQAVADVYKKYFETIQALGSADEATIRAKLAPYAEGPAVEKIVTGMAYFRSLNQQPAGSVVFAALDVAITGDTATVRECHDGTTELIVDSTTGAVVSNGVVEGLETQLVRTGGTWRVTSYDKAEGLC